MAPFADMLDTADGGQRYQGALQDLRSRIDLPETTPSKDHTQNLQAVGLDDQTLTKFKTSVQDALAAQQQVDAASEGPFEDFVAAYFTD